MATIKDIAARAGVSHATVSNVLSGRATPGRRDAVARAKEIRRIAKELDYRPHTAAVTLRGGRSGMVAVLGDTPMTIDSDRTEERQIIMEFADLLNERLGSDLTFRLGLRNGGPFDLPPWKVDAAVVLGVATEEDLQPVERSMLPYVGINAERGRRPGTSAVLYDDHAAVAEAVDRFVVSGHRRIAFINGPTGFTHRSVEERRRGYIDAIRGHGLDPVPGHEQGTFDAELTRDDLLWLRRDHAATAFLTYEPLVAASLYRVAEDLGLKIPRDLSVITFNESQVGNRFLRPRLACLTRPARPTAEAAVELLAELLGEGPDAGHADRRGRTIVIRQKLVGSESIGPAPSR